MGDGDALPPQFRLYDSRKAAFDRQYQFHLEYLVFLKDSIRGLRFGAPVEYRGLRVGTVNNINIDLDDAQHTDAELQKMIPVLIRIEPGRVGYGDSQAGLEDFRGDFADWMGGGLSAKLKTGNLISGSQFISLDFGADASTTFPDSYAGYRVIPSSQDSLGHITEQVENLLDKLNSLPLEETVSSANRSLRQIEAAAAKIDSLLASDSPDALPQQLGDSLQQLDKTLAGVGPDSALYQQIQQVLNELKYVLDDFQPLVRELNNQPSQLIFSKPRSKDQQPVANQ